jgi:adenylate cyclase
MTDFVAIITRFAPEGVIGDMDGVYSSWATRAPHGFNDVQIAALQRIVPYLALAIKSVSLARMTGTLMETYLGRDAGHRVLSGRIMRGIAYHRHCTGTGYPVAERLLRCDRLGDRRAWR